MSDKYNPFSIAVVDLFASSLGAFMVLAFVALPFLTKTDSSAAVGDPVKTIVKTVFKDNSEKVDFLKRELTDQKERTNMAKVKVANLEVAMADQKRENKQLRSQFLARRQAQDQLINDAVKKQVAAQLGTLKLRDASSLTGRYSGTYSCTQGRTSLTLAIQGHRSGRVDAKFDFRYGSSIQGSFTMTGYYRRNGDLVLLGERWLKRPGDWNTLSMKGSVSQGAYSGIMIGCPPGRDDFSVRRS